MTDQTKTVEFQPSGRGKARCSPNPDYPEGIVLPKPPGAGECCHVDLPYPAPECGVHVITCKLCKGSMAVTAAGRPDDPISCEMPCHIRDGLVA